jgi:hypothetical protein
MGLDNATMRASTGVAKVFSANTMRAVIFELMHEELIKVDDEGHATQSDCAASLSWALHRFPTVNHRFEREVNRNRDLRPTFFLLTNKKGVV